MGKTINFKRTLAVCLAFLLFGLSCIFQTNNNNANAANTSVSYKVFNAQTGDYLRSYTLNSLRSENNLRSGVIGTEDRVIDWSKSGVVKIIINNSGFGSGFVVDEHTIATAKHCLYDNKGLKISDIILFNSNGGVSMHATPVESHVPVNNGDYGLITVEEDLSNYMCFNIGTFYDKYSAIGIDISATGFPGNLNNNYNIPVNTINSHAMYTGTGKIVAVDMNIGSVNLDFDADSTPGNSGGPIYMTETRCGKTYYTVIGIVTGMGGDYNCGKCMDTDLLHFLISNENISY